jgi:hypothetical protein
MRIPSNLQQREELYLDLVRKCKVSQQERKADYNSLRAYYLFGAGPEESPSAYNKIYPHIDQLVAFLYSADSTRFAINLGASAPDTEYTKIPRLTQALNDKWSDSNGDHIFGLALNWAMCYDSAFVKLIVNKGQIFPYYVDPAMMGMLREDVPHSDRQEAFTHTYYITKSDLYARLYNHPKREELIKRITAGPTETHYVASGIDRIVLSQVDPMMMGNVNLDLNGYNRMKPRVEEETIEMTELYVWNDEIHDYMVVTKADPDVVIYDRPNETMFLKGESPFIQICPNPMPDYFWGQSEVSRLIYLQQMYNRRMGEILDLLAKQVNPPTALMGFTGILDEKNFALNRPGGLLSTDMPNAKADRLAPQMPADLYEQIKQIDNWFEEASGISSVLSGRGESGVRSAGHASQLARLGSSRAKRRALQVELSLEKMATLYMKLIQAYDPTHYKDADGMKFIAEQFTKDYMVKVDAHSNSPIFMEDTRSMAFNLFKAGAIDKESLLDLIDPPMKQMLKEKLKKASSAPQPEGGNVTPIKKEAKSG